jgi:dienelactone hydrolase
MGSDSISLQLPTELGLVEARIFADSIVGRVVLEDEVTARLRLFPRARSVVRETDISFANPLDGTRIAATVMSPEGPGPFPAVVVLHGGGDSSREQAPGYRFWGTWLARNGIVGLVYDKRGNGESGGAWKEVGFDARAVDVATAVQNLRGMPSVDPRRVGLLGVSQGSWVAGLVAAADPELAFVVNVSGPAVPVAAADGYAMRRGLLERGAPPEAVDRLTDFWWMEVDAILHGDSGRVHRLEREVQKSADAPWFEAFSYSVGPVDGWWWNWYSKVADHDPVPVLRTTDVPMLWVYGDVDTESEVSRNIAVLEQLRDDGKDYEIAVFPRAGHGLMVPADRLGRSEGTLTVAPGFFRAVFDYIRR